MDSMPLWLMYMQAGAYAAVMIAVLGVPQVLLWYFDNRLRRREYRESESSAERRHRELLEERREERRLAEEARRQEYEERRLAEEERRQEYEERRRTDEERRQEYEERRRTDEERRRAEDDRRQAEEERRREFEFQRLDAERRHQEMMALIIQMGNGAGRRVETSESETIRAMQETIDALESENARLRRENGGGEHSGQSGGDGAAG